MYRLLLHLIFIFPLFSFAGKANPPATACEISTKMALEKMMPMLDKNNYTALEAVLLDLEKDCGPTEFTLRLRILRALLERQETSALIKLYYQQNYPEVLIMRWDYSMEEKQAEIYKNNKADFNYVPLRHPIDSLIKLKAQALLQSSSFDLKPEERRITLLFADHIDAFTSFAGQNSNATFAEQPNTTPARRYKDAKDRAGIIIYVGAETAISASKPVFRTNATLGLFYSSKLSRDFLYELGIKIRSNSNGENFDYWLYDKTENINSSASFSFGGTLGYKLYDSKQWIFYPKVGLFWESTATGLSEVITSDSWWGNDYYDNSSVRFHNVNTMRSSVAVTMMRHIRGKQYIGLEAAYHYIPYNWDTHLLTSIQPNYASIQLSYRF